MKAPDPPEKEVRIPGRKEKTGQFLSAKNDESGDKDASWKRKLAETPFGAAALIIIVIAGGFWASVRFTPLGQVQTFVIAILVLLVLLSMMVVFLKIARPESPAIVDSQRAEPLPSKLDQLALHRRLLEIWGQQHRPDFGSPHDDNNERAAYKAVTALEQTALLWNDSCEDEREFIAKTAGGLAMDWMDFLDHHPIKLSSGVLLRAEINADSLTMMQEIRRYGVRQRL